MGQEYTQERMNELAQELQHTKQYLDMVEEKIDELTGAQEALEELQKTSVGEEILVPVSSGIFVRAKIEDTKSFVVNVGAKVLVEKSCDDLQVLLRGQVADISKSKDELIEQFEALYTNYVSMHLAEEKKE